MTPQPRRPWPWNRTRLTPPQHHRRHACRRAKLATLERLEDRTLMAIFTPTSFTDSFDPKAPQPISLRDAIIAANNDTGAATDTIVLKPGTYTLNLTNRPGPRQNFSAHTGELDITNTRHQLIIEGSGATIIAE